MRLFYPESAHFDPRTENNPDTLLVLVPFKPMDFQWMEAILNDKKRVSVVGNQVQPLPDCSRVQTSSHPSLGTYNSNRGTTGHLRPLCRFGKGFGNSLR